MQPKFHIEIENERFDTEQKSPERICYRATGICRMTRDGLRVQYAEPQVTGMDGTTTTVTVLQDGTVSVNRVGPLNSMMVFEAGKMHVSIYDTGYFPIQMCIFTHSLQNTLSVHGGTLEITFDLEIGGRLASKNRMKLTVTPQDAVSIPS